ncbi:MAG: acetyl-CoA carboxylase carboxyltransferase subunit beta [Lachnospiraceae bacterium]|jgi:acetyl-CoA carboxylase carboxyl transferase subunit beta|nr:acetyl-CoA carboxylase carboxyltransferase subunit beta [Lachnospiraceae bacterium]
MLFRKQERQSKKMLENYHKEQLSEGLFQKCEACNRIVYTEDVIEDYHICPSCGHYFRVAPMERLAMVLDQGSFEEWDKDLETKNPLDFPDYEKKVAKMKQNTGLSEAVVTGKGKIGGVETAIGVMSSKFLMGSMGMIVGEKITNMVERATKEKLPVILFCCSGGARMQEGIMSLMQMAKTSQALKKHDQAGLMYISVLTDPTTGGVTASFAMLGDVILAEPKALIGFAGPRVIEQTIHQKLPEGFQSAEFLLEHGMIDKIVSRKKMRKVLHYLLLSSGANKAH